jgi:hypothetical protein
LARVCPRRKSPGRFRKWSLTRCDIHRPKKEAVGHQGAGSSHTENRVPGCSVAVMLKPSGDFREPLKIMNHLRHLRHREKREKRGKRKASTVFSPLTFSVPLWLIGFYGFLEVPLITKSKT